MDFSKLYILQLFTQFLTLQYKYFHLLPFARMFFFLCKWQNKVLNLLTLD